MGHVERLTGQRGEWIQVYKTQAWLLRRSNCLIIGGFAVWYSLFCPLSTGPSHTQRTYLHVLIVESLHKIHTC
jgi:hypothetical protein